MGERARVYLDAVRCSVTRGRWLLAPAAGLAIRKRRKFFRWSQAELARCAGLSACTVQALERVQRGVRATAVPRAVTLYALGEALDCEFVVVYEGRQD